MYIILCILIHMSKNKRLQIPISEAEEGLLKSAARRAGLPFAAWARNVLREKASESGSSEDLSPEQILESLFSLNAPVSSVDKMIEESTGGRYSE